MYKVVWYSRNKEYESVCRNPNILPEKYRVEYKVNEFAYPILENSKLFCFEDLESARLLAASMPFCSVFKCEVINPTPNYLKCSSYLNIESFWKYGTISQRGSLMLIPDGTYLCDAIKITERVI